MEGDEEEMEDGRHKEGGGEKKDGTWRGVR